MGKFFIDTLVCGSVVPLVVTGVIVVGPVVVRSSVAFVVALDAVF